MTEINLSTDQLADRDMSAGAGLEAKAHHVNLIDMPKVFSGRLKKSNEFQLCVP